MSQQNKKQPAKKSKAAAKAPPTEPIDVVDAIADRHAQPPRWKLLVLGGLFVAWIAFMLYCQLAGAPAK